MSIEWEKIRTDYISSKMTYAALAQKYSINASNLARRAREGRWAEARKAYRESLSKATLRKSLYRRSEKAADKLARIDKSACLMLDQLAAVLEGDEHALERFAQSDPKTGEVSQKRLKMVNAPQAAQLAKTLQTLADVIRDVNDKPRKKEEPEQESNQRIEIGIETDWGEQGNPATAEKAPQGTETQESKEPETGKQEGTVEG